MVRLLFLTAWCSDSTLDSRRVLLCVNDYRTFREAQVALYTATNRCIGYQELVACGNRVKLDGVVEWIPVAMLQVVEVGH